MRFSTFAIILTIRCSFETAVMVPTATAERLKAPVARILDETRRLFVSASAFEPADTTWTAWRPPATPGLFPGWRND